MTAATTGMVMTINPPVGALVVLCWAVVNFWVGLRVKKLRSSVPVKSSTKGFFVGNAMLPSRWLRKQGVEKGWQRIEKNWQGFVLVAVATFDACDYSQPAVATGSDEADKEEKGSVRRQCLLIVVNTIVKAPVASVGSDTDGSGNRKGNGKKGLLMSFGQHVQCALFNLFLCRSQVMCRGLALHRQAKETRRG
jgi:hypothetical protein